MDAAEQRRRLRAATLADLAQGLRFPAGMAGTALRTIASPVADRFARWAMTLDACVGHGGLAAGGAMIVDRFTRGLRVDGRGDVPRSGPLLVVANHPGVADAAALFVALDARPDLLVLAADREFFRCLPNLGRHLIAVPQHLAHRAEPLRRARAHLRAGGAVLTFPAGRIEPDPALRLDAADALATWSQSTAVLVRGEPGTIVLPVAVSGVLSVRALRHPLARRFALADDRERAAATLQVFVPWLRDTLVRVVVGRPIGPGELGPRPTRAEVSRLVGQEMSRIIRAPAQPRR